MSALAPLLTDALAAYRKGDLDLAGLASWASDEIESWLGDPAHRYSYREDIALEAYDLVSAADDAPEPDLELAEAEALLSGDRPFAAARLLLVDPTWVAQTAAAEAASLASDLGGRIERGSEGRAVAAHGGPLLAKLVEGLAGDDYVELLCAEAAAICEDLRRSVNGEVEVLGRGRPRIDASILAERLAAVGQVLRSERPLRALVRGRGAAGVQVVLSY